MTKKLSKFDENHKLTDPRSSANPNKINEKKKKNLPRHVTTTLLKITYKIKKLKATRRKKNVMMVKNKDKNYCRFIFQKK